MKKNIWYFQLQVKNRNTDQYIKGESLKKLFDTIKVMKSTHYDANKDMYSIVIKQDAGSKDLKKDVTLDIYSTDKNYLFGTLCSTKDHNSAQKREHESLRTEQIMSDAELGKSKFEMISYFILNYEDSIISFVQTLSAPRITPLSNLTKFDEFKKYTIVATPIVEPDVLSKVFQANYIENITYTCSVPDIQCLSGLNLSDDVLQELDKSVVKDITVRLTTRRFKSIKSPKFIQAIVEKVKSGYIKKSKVSVKKNFEDDYLEYNLITNKICFDGDFELNTEQPGDTVKESMRDKMISIYEDKREILNDFIKWV